LKSLTFNSDYFPFSTTVLELLVDDVSFVMSPTGVINPESVADEVIKFKVGYVSDSISFS